VTNVKYSETQADPTISRVEDWLIRDLVEAHPETLGVLAPLGIDLCCGGGHPLGEALDLHGLDCDAVLPRVARVIAGSAPETE
jgi:iron-sulfur cluster repair protein YtfE (RIC family)